MTLRFILLTTSALSRDLLLITENCLKVETRKAESEMAYQQQAAISKQSIKEAEMQVIVEERRKQIEVSDQEILRREKELEAQIKKPAEAEKYRLILHHLLIQSLHQILLFRLETLAAAERRKIVLEAEAEAESIRLKGEAQSFAIQAKATAEAEQMAKKAEAWKDYQEAAMVDMVLSTLPKIAAEVAAPLTTAKKITMVSSGDGDVGAAKLTGEVIDVIGKLPEMVKNLTGIDIASSIKVKK